MFNVKDEGIKNIERFTERPEITKEYIEKAIAQVLKKIDGNLETFSEKFPSSASFDLVYKPVENNEWTTSFWPGMLWLAYEVTNDEKYRKLGEKFIQNFKKRLDNKMKIDTHDLGFLYSLSCVSAYRLTGNEEAKEIALRAADHLLTRFHDKAEIIQAWGDLTDPKQQGRMIIDCNMNLPLLYWATEVTGDPKYKELALKHAKQAAKYLVREDSSTYHTYYMDVDTGEPKYGDTHQGFSDDSSWARGQAWAIYGFPLTYIYVDDYDYIELSKKLTHYYLNRLPEDLVNYWDLIFTDGDEERDSSAAAIAVCGLLEISKHLPLTDEHKTIYENAALHITKSLTENYVSTNEDENGVLLHSVYVRPVYRGVDEFCIWGDYYYFEALVRLLKDWKLYW